jgi:GNAT superfamily N-acetyltransferase
MARASRVVLAPLTPERLGDLERLFGPRGACAGCWCMYPRRRHAEFQRGRGAPNRRAFRRLVHAGTVPGLLAYVGGEPAGWCAVEPRAAYPRLATSRVLAPVDDLPVWSIVCFFVARAHRGRGLTRHLIEGAVTHARRAGARIVEAYPVDPTTATVPPVFAWTGLASAFRKTRFVEVARRSPSRPIVRRRITR